MATKQTIVMQKISDARQICWVNTENVHIVYIVWCYKTHLKS
jgi:hypothetical protein